MKFINRTGLDFRKEEYQDRLSLVAEKLNDEQTELENEVIPFDTFTTEWLKDSLPSDNWEWELYKQERKNWFRDLNILFDKRNYPLWIQVMPRMGMVLRRGPRAVYYRTTSHLRRAVLATVKAVKDSVSLQKSFGEDNPRINYMIRCNQENLYHYVISAEMSPYLSPADKEEIKSFVVSKIQNLEDIKEL